MSKCFAFARRVVESGRRAVVPEGMRVLKVVFNHGQKDRNSHNKHRAAAAALVLPAGSDSALFFVVNFYHGKSKKRFGEQYKFAVFFTLHLRFADNQSPPFFYHPSFG